MGIEIEAKFRLPDPERLRQKLMAAGARRVRAVLEHNTYFDTPEHALRDGDCGLRLRIAETRDAQRDVVVTYKGPREPGEMNIRSENEVAVRSAEDAAAFLKALGYAPTLSFQKRRESFELAGARIELDELPELGYFLEIEADDERTVNRVRTKLGLEKEPAVTSSYIALVAEHLQAKAGQDSTELRF